MRFISFVIISVLVCLHACQAHSDEIPDKYETYETVEVSMEVSIRVNNLTVFGK